MITLLIALVLLGLSVAGIVVRKTYDYVPLVEMKRLAKKKDPLASVLYPVASYEASLRLLLAIWIAITAAAGFVLLAHVVPLFLSILGVAVLLCVAFIMVPSTRTGRAGEQLTVAVTPLLAWILGYFYPLLGRAARLIRRRFHLTVRHTGMFEREDLLHVLEAQQAQNDNRLSPEELDIARRALTFDEHTVSDILTTRKHVKTVLAEEVLGPILIDELHQDHQKNVLVRESKKGPFVGTLDFAHLDLRHTGKVSEVMNDKVYYVHEDDSLSDALHAFFVTNHAIFIVVNSFEEYVGILTVENILRQLLGHIPGDPFDRYSDIAAVAARHHKVPKTEESGATEVPEKDLAVKN